MAMVEPPLPTLDVAVHSTLQEMLGILRRIDERLHPASPQTGNAGTLSDHGAEAALSTDVGATVHRASPENNDTVEAESILPAELRYTASSTEDGFMGHISADSSSLSEPVNSASSDAGQPTSPKIYSLLESILGVLRRFDEVAVDDVDSPPGSEKKLEKTFRLKWFGLDKQQLNPALANIDYRLKYPDDEPGHELDENARVWLAYNEEANAYDTDWINALADSLDILLVFAGLFSAVLTTFVAQTSQLLSIESPSGNALWVNGLWFTSLTISLCVALFAVLSKQWLRQYMSIITGSAREQALIRQFRFDGLTTWRVQGIVGVLPILLHLSLILFLVGLIVFLYPLSVVMAWISGGITLTAITLYAGANLLPLLFVQCPYRTTFTDLMHVTSAYLRSWNLYFHYSVAPEASYQDLKTTERQAACAANQTKDLRCLVWLAESTSSASAKDLIFWSLGALMPSAHPHLQELNIDHALYSALRPYSSQEVRVTPFRERSAVDPSWRKAVETYFDAHESDPKVQGRMCRSLLSHGLLLSLHDSFCDDRMPTDDLQLALTAMGTGIARHVDFQCEGHRIKLGAHNWVSWLSVGSSDYFDKIISEFRHMQLPRAIWHRLLEQNIVALSSLPSALVVELSLLRDPRFLYTSTNPNILPPASPYPVVLRDACLKDEAVKLLCGSSVTCDDLDNELRHRWGVTVAKGLLSPLEILSFPPRPGYNDKAFANVQRVETVEREDLPAHVMYVQRGDRIFRS